MPKACGQNITTISGQTPNLQKRLAEQDLFDWSAAIHPLRETEGFIPSLPSSDTVQAKAGIVPLANGLYEIKASWIERIGNEDVERELKLEFAL